MCVFVFVSFCFLFFSFSSQRDGQCAAVTARRMQTPAWPVRRAFQSSLLASKLTFCANNGTIRIFFDSGFLIFFSRVCSKVHWRETLHPECGLREPTHADVLSQRRGVLRVRERANLERVCCCVDPSANYFSCLISSHTAQWTRQLHCDA